MYEYNVVEHDGTYTLQNRTRSGEIQEFGDLCFHGGPGATLEMRVFSETGLLADLNAAGFDSIKIHRPLDFRHGVWWPEAWSLPISARRPAA